MSLPPSLASVGLLILRAAFGGMMLVHGIPKLMGFREMSGQFPDPLSMGSQLSLMAAIGAEVGCSLLLILGLGTRFAAIPLAITMMVALLVVHASDPWNLKELAAVYFAVYVSLVFTGGGRFSLDDLFSKHRPTPDKEDAMPAS